MKKFIIFLLIIIPIVVFAEPSAQPFIAFLRQLKDVLISSPADKEILSYDGTSSKWQNKTINDVADGDYVNITGDTMTGNLNMSGSEICFDSDTCVVFDGTTLILTVNGSTRQTWYTTPTVSFLLLETGDYFLLENGDNLILE